MIAIKTKLIPATDTKGTRIRASLPMQGAGHISRCKTIPYDYEFDNLHNHKIATWMLRAHLNLDDRLALEWVGTADTGRGEKTHLYRATERRS